MADDELEVGVGPWPGDVAGRPAARPRAARARRPAQRRRPLPLLAARGGRRRPRRAPARLPRRDRELAARLQHRLGRAHRERVPRPRGAHRRQPAVEPPRRDGHRPLPARAPPRRRRGARRAGRRRARCRSSASTTCRARCRWSRPGCRAPACCCSARRGRACPPAAREARLAGRARSRSSARPGRSTPARPRRSPCTPGSASTSSATRSERSRLQHRAIGPDGRRAGTRSLEAVAVLGSRHGRRRAAAAFDRQIRRRPEPQPGFEVELLDDPAPVLRMTAAGGARPWGGGVFWCDLDESTADAAIAAALDDFAAARPRVRVEALRRTTGRPTCPTGCARAGFQPDEEEALIVGEVAVVARPAARRHRSPRASRCAGCATDPEGAAADWQGINELSRAVWDEDGTGDERAPSPPSIAADPAGTSMWLAVADGRHGGLRGAGQLPRAAPTSRRCGAAAPSRPYRRPRHLQALVSRRADEAAERGFRFLQVDASPDSRPILERLGLRTLTVDDPVELAAVASPHERALVVVGATRPGMSRGVAGQAACGRRASRSSRSSAATHTSYSACGIPYWVGGDGRPDVDALVDPDAGGAPGQRHRPAAAARGHGDRPGPARGGGPRPRGRHRRTGSASTTSSSRPAPRPRRPDVPGVDARGHPRRADPGRRRAAARVAGARRRAGPSSWAAATSASRWPRRWSAAASTVTVVDPVGRADGHARPGHGPAGAPRRWRAWASTCAPRSGWTGFETDADGRVTRGRRPRRRRPGRPRRARHRGRARDDAGSRRPG